MKKLIFFILIFSMLTALGQTKKRVLFIGNSYTYVNNLPQIIKDIASSKGDTLAFSQSVMGGATFNTHFQNPTTYSFIQAQNWDAVVIQGQSQEAALSTNSVMTNSYPYLKSLTDSVRKYHSCAEVMYFMTWGRKNSDADFCPTYTPSCSYEGMQARLRMNYLMFADSFNASCAPVGVAWKKLRALYPSVELYDLDESHPSIQGSYLAASVFYSSIFRKNVIGATYFAGVDPMVAACMHQVAGTTVMDSIAVWNINSQIPSASFSYSNIGLNTFQFYNTSSNALNYAWSFGSFVFSPSHTFSESPPYVVTLQASNQCTSATNTQTLSIVGITENENCFGLTYGHHLQKLFLNRSCKEDQNIRVAIYDLQGKSVYMNREFKEEEIDLSFLDDGIYVASLTSSYGVRRLRFVK